MFFVWFGFFLENKAYYLSDLALQQLIRQVYQTEILSDNRVFRQIYQTILSDKFWGILPLVIRQVYQTNLSDRFCGIQPLNNKVTRHRQIARQLDANQAWKVVWWTQLNCGGSLGCTHTTDLLKPDSDITRPAQACLILPGLLRPDATLKNQEAPGPMKVFGGGLPPTFALQEASAFNFQTSAIEMKPWTIIDPLSKTMDTSTIHTVTLRKSGFRIPN